MCGLAGMLGPRASADTVRSMVSALRHRGPDDEGFWGRPGVWLGHRRLSVIDLATGHQPIHNEDETVWIVFNGEIYNFADLRDDLEARGHRFYTRSDTEVIVHLYEERGPEGFALLNGIFAFALWDEKKRCGVLARDHLGVKPLHYRIEGDSLAFASEIKGLLADPAAPRRLNPQALHDFLNVRFVPGEETLFADIHRLPPAHYLLWQDGEVSLRRFWELRAGEDHTVAVDDWCEGIRERLLGAVRRQLVSDVPLGLYLSGGMDSSAIVAAAMRAGAGSIDTFTLGFNEPTDELEDARVVSAHLGTRHHETTIDANPLRDLPEVIWHVEEPKVNILQGYLLAEFARQQVTVALSGLGGDELFVGYDIYPWAAPLAPIHRWVPDALSRGPLAWLSQAAFDFQEGRGTYRWQQHRLGVQWLASVGNPARTYALLRNAWDFNDGASERLYGPVLRDGELMPVETHFERYFRDRRGNVVEQTLRAELEGKMVNDFLLNEDRVSMAHGLEVRVPLLDLDLVEYAWRIPTRVKYRRGRTKALFRDALGPWLPPRVLAKKKWGFTFSSYHQFQKDLKPAAERVLTPRRVEEVGWFNYPWIRSVLDHPAHPRLRWHYFVLWMMVGFEIWRQMFLGPGGGTGPRHLEDYFG